MTKGAARYSNEVFYAMLSGIVHLGSPFSIHPSRGALLFPHVIDKEGWFFPCHRS